ncbi:anti-sigma factor domain-containing protein [Gordonia cholesterolivorans]
MSVPRSGSTRDHPRDLLPLHALDALDELDRRRVEAHLQTCPECAAAWAAWQETAADLSTDADPVPPPVRAALMRAVDGEASAAPSAGRSRRSRRWVRAAAAACIAVAAAGGVVTWRVVADHRPSATSTSGTSMDDVLAAPDMEKATGAVGDGTVKAMYAPSQRATVVSVENLPPTDHRTGYQVWITVDGRKKSAGMVHGADTSSVIMTDMSRPADVSLSVEPMTGSPQPTSPMVVQFPIP